nr:hypothetical protein [Yersinia pseudotuberculosis]
MHLMYFRFFHKLLRDAGLVDSDEPPNACMSGDGTGCAFYYTGNNGERIGFHRSMRLSNVMTKAVSLKL